MKHVRYLFFFLCFSPFMSDCSLRSISQQLGKKLAKKIPTLSGKLGAKIGERLAWPIASRFLGTLSPYLLRIGLLGTMFREKIAKPRGTISLIGGLSSVAFFMFSLQKLREKMREYDEKIQALEKQLQTFNEKIKELKIPAKGAEPEQEVELPNIAEESTMLQVLEVQHRAVEASIKELIAKRNDKIKLFFKIAAPFSKILLFALYGGIAYGLQYSGSLIEWIGQRGVDQTWGGKFAPK